MNTCEIVESLYWKGSCKPKFMDPWMEETRTWAGAHFGWGVECSYNQRERHCVVNFLYKSLKSFWMWWHSGALCCKTICWRERAQEATPERCGKCEAARGHKLLRLRLLIDEVIPNVALKPFSFALKMGSHKERLHILSAGMDSQADVMLDCKGWGDMVPGCLPFACCLRRWGRVWEGFWT